jgi:hypothetical protein
LYQNEEDIFGGLNPEEIALIDHLSQDLGNQLPPEVILAAPLGIGNHVDHEITRKAVRELEIPVYYYADYPYLRDPDGLKILALMDSSEDWEKETFPITDSGLVEWHRSSLAYSSQISIFWESENSLLDEIRGILDIFGGLTLWNPVENE